MNRTRKALICFHRKYLKLPSKSGLLLVKTITITKLAPLVVLVFIASGEINFADLAISMALVPYMLIKGAALSMVVVIAFFSLIYFIFV